VKLINIRKGILTMANTRLRVLIIGAGTGGLCLAHGLRRAGIEVAVFERDHTRRDGLYGYRVGIDPDGSRALRACLPPALFDTFVATCARAGDYSNMLTEQLREVLSTSGWAPADPKAIGAERSVSRMTLRQVLLTGMEDVVSFGKCFTRFQTDPDGTVTAFFEDGSSATGDVLVGADGSNSRVRRQYLPHARLVDAGLIGITGKVALTEQTRALLTPKMIDGVSMIFAPKGYNCILHVMRFPWDANGAPKKGIGATDAELIASWPGMQFDNTRDYIMWGFGGAAKNLPGDVLSFDGPRLHQLVGQLTKKWHPNLRKLFALADPNSCFPLNIRTSVPIPQWPTTTVTLIGDAIHTMTPGRGVGANTALRDAKLLCANLTAARAGDTTLLAGIRDYETQMIKYGAEAVKKSLKQMSGSNPIHTPVLGRVVLAGMRTGMRLANHLPPIKNRMAASEQTLRGHDREEVPA
jgi:2-polyprenyl-6-methoxyphenol hydroxylase-like FAD-dependent oxidoreductase